MKKTIIWYVMIMFLGEFYNAKAQNAFAPLGAEWWYQGNNYNYTSWPGGLIDINEVWTDHVKVIKDTTINNVDCRQLSITRTIRRGDLGDSILTLEDRFLYMYDNLDTAFVYHERDETFKTLYVFNISEGDTLHLALPMTGIDGIDSMHLVVDSVILDKFDGQSLRSYYTRAYTTYYYGGSYATYNYGSTQSIHTLESTGKYTQRLGMTLPDLSGFFPYYTTDFPEGVLPFTFPSGNLVCYKDNDYEIHLTENDCNFIPMPVSGIKSIKQNVPLNLSPNPAYSQFNIEGDERMPLGTIVKVYDLSGRVVLPIMDVSAQLKVSIDIRQLPEGLYIVRVEGRDQYSYHKLIVQR